jgi:hypothetical protein
MFSELLMDAIRFPDENLMTPEHRTALTRLMNREDFRRSRRPTWLPVTEEGEDRAKASKYGGLPWLSRDESWPPCGHYHRAMHLFFQINLRELPADVGGVFGDGMLQFFYYKRRDCVEDYAGKFPPDDMNVVRLVDLDVPGRPGPEHDGPEDLFPVRVISQWKTQIDYHPHGDELEEQGIEVTYEELDLFPGFGLIENADKLGGWPAWIHSPDYTPCPSCGRNMPHIFQFTPQVHLNYSFGQEFFRRPGAKDRHRNATGLGPRCLCWPTIITLQEMD